jgi:hypothetical protein
VGPLGLDHPTDSAAHCVCACIRVSSQKRKTQLANGRELGCRRFSRIFKRPQAEGFKSALNKD